MCVCVRACVCVSFATLTHKRSFDGSFVDTSFDVIDALPIGTTVPGVYARTPLTQGAYLVATAATSTGVVLTAGGRTASGLRCALVKHLPSVLCVLVCVVCVVCVCRCVYVDEMCRVVCE